MISFLDEEFFPQFEPFSDCGGDFGGDGRLFGRGRRVNAALIVLGLFDVDERLGKDSKAITVFRFEPVVPGREFNRRLFQLLSICQ